MVSSLNPIVLRLFLNFELIPRIHMLGDFIQKIYISKISVFSRIIRRAENIWLTSHIS